jgi:hypothetical protein
LLTLKVMKEHFPFSYVEICQRLFTIIVDEIQECLVRRDGQVLDKVVALVHVALTSNKSEGPLWHSVARFKAVVGAKLLEADDGYVLDCVSNRLLRFFSTFEDVVLLLEDRKRAKANGLKRKPLTASLVQNVRSLVNNRVDCVIQVACSLVASVASPICHRKDLKLSQYMLELCVNLSEPLRRPSDEALSDDEPNQKGADSGKRGNSGAGGYKQLTNKRFSEYCKDKLPII